MSTLLITHDACLAHDTGLGHPECSDRLRAVGRALEGGEFADLLRMSAPLASADQLKRVHPADFIAYVQDGIPKSGLSYLDGDTPVSPGSREAALRAAGAVCAGID